MAEITHLFHVDASPETVYQAITTIDGLKRWWTKQTSGGEAVGDLLEFRFGENGFIDFKIIALEEKQRVQWECVDAHPEWIGTRAMFQISENEGKTKIHFTHSGWQEQTEFFAHCNFSWGKYFISLRALCETGKGDPFTI